MFTTLTFSHLLELSRIADITQRAFFELYCLKERWSVREFQRQRDSMLYERIGLSEDRDAVLALARAGSLADSPAGQLRDPYVFEFLNMERCAVVSESDVERSVVDHLQQFLFELGRDFCFIARQFRITAGNRPDYVDLLLFHRRLRCLVAIDLKLGAFEPSTRANFGSMSTTSPNTSHIRKKIPQWEFFSVPNAIQKSCALPQPATTTSSSAVTSSSYRLRSNSSSGSRKNARGLSRRKVTPKVGSDMLDSTCVHA
ncbi:MAG: PDDEXK nuclease domain-containing protein [Steroidobacteraceae bacterium]